MSKTMTFLRRNQKVVFSILCAVLVVTWGLSYSADQLMGLRGGARGRDPGAQVVLTWAGGKVTQRDIAEMRRAHYNAVRYVFAVMQKAQENQGRPAVPMLDQSREAPQGSPIPPTNEPQTVIDIMLRAEKARRMGIQINDAAVKQFLLRLAGDVLREGDLGAIARETLGHEMSDEALMEQLKEELLAQQVRLLSISSLTTLSLGEDWEYFRRLNRRMQIEAYGIDVAKFEDEVKGQPSQKDLRTLFDKYKENDPDPTRPEPGFRNLKRVAWEYVKIDFKPHLEAAKKTITDEQVKKYYDEAIARGEFKAKPAEEKKPEEKSEDGDKKEPDANAPEKKAGDAKSEDKNPDEAKPGEPKADEKKPASGEAKPDEAKPENKSDEPKPASDEVTAGDPSSKQAADKATAEKSDEAKADPPAKPEQQNAADKPAAGKPAADKPEDAKTEPAEQNKPEDGKPSDAKAEETKFKPLEEVRDEIVTILARPIAQDTLNKDVQKLIDALREYKVKQRKYEDYQRIEKSQTTKTKRTPVEPPGEFDAAAIAKRIGAQHITTPLVTRYELAEEELGREGMIFFREVFQFLPFADVAYSRRMTPYEPMDVFFRGEAEEKVIVWAIKEEAPPPLRFDDRATQERLVAAWRKQQAVDLAREAAKKIAIEAAAKDTLQEALPEEAKVQKPAPFSWLTGGAFTPAMGARVTLSQVEGIDQAGPEFMEAVSRLKVGETGVAINHPHSRVYVVRLLEQEPSEEDLRERFLESGSSMAVRQAAGQDVGRFAQEWEEQLAAEMKVAYQGSRSGLDVMEEQ